MKRRPIGQHLEKIRELAVNMDVGGFIKPAITGKHFEKRKKTTTY